jgi:hypothetical protein
MLPRDEEIGIKPLVMNSFKIWLDGFTALRLRSQMPIIIELLVYNHYKINSTQYYKRTTNSFNP